MDSETTKLIELYVVQQRGLAAVGYEFGHGPSWARSRLVAAGVKIRAQSTTTRRLPAAEHVRALLDGGWSVPDIAAQLNYSASSVRKVMNRHGWRPPARRPGGRRAARSTQASLDQLADLVAQGMEPEEIAAQLGITTRSAARAMKLV